MAGEWETVPLGEFYDFSSGLSKPRSEFGSGYPFLAFKDVFYSFFVPKELSQLVNSTDQERAKCSVRRGDVFLTRTSETMNELGMSCVALRDIANATFNGFTKRLRPKINDKVVPEYAGYYFRSPQFRQSVTAMSSMSTRASLNNEMLARLSIDLPPLQEQVAIGHILGSLDDKIELNRRMSATLEAMARALFKSWFVDFDPVRAKMEGRYSGLPKHIADLFPDRLVDSELGEIPEGWEVGTFGNVVEQLGDKENPLASPEVSFRHFSIPAFDDGQSPKRELGESIKSQKSRVPPGAVLLSKLNPEIERVWLVDVKPEDRAICSTEFLVLRPRLPFTRSYVYCLARVPVFRQELAGLVTGTSKSHQRAQPASILEMNAIMPPESLTIAFEHVVGPLLQRTLECRSESLNLAAARDTLFPKLLSGELRVGDRSRLLESA